MNKFIQSTGMMLLIPFVQAAELHSPPNPTGDVIHVREDCENAKPDDSWSVDFEEGVYCSYEREDSNSDDNLNKNRNRTITGDNSVRSRFRLQNESGLLLWYAFASSSGSGYMSKGVWVAAGQSYEFDTKGLTQYKMKVEIDSGNLISNPLWQLFYSQTLPREYVLGKDICVQAWGTLFNYGYESCFEEPIVDDCVYAYEHGGYNGDAIKVCESKPNLHSFNNKMSSYIIPHGWEIRFFEGENYTGNFWTRDYRSEFDSSLNDRVKSIKILSK